MTGSSRVWTVVVAAGSGTRFGGPKHLADLAGQRVLDRSVATATGVSDGVVVVVAADQVVDITATISADGVTVVAGGDSRSESVRLGMAAVASDAEVILVHDGARPLADRVLYERAIMAVSSGADAAVPAVPVTDTIRRIGGGVVDRSTLVAVQTPQAFRAEALRQAHDAGGDATDDASLVEAQGGTVMLVDGSRDNIKITNPEDLAIAHTLVAMRSEIPRSEIPRSDTPPEEVSP